MLTLRYKTFVLLLLCAVMTASCTSTTKALWRATDPGNKVWVPASKIDEEKLIRKNIKYKKYVKKGPDGDELYYIVKKGWLRKTGNYTARIFGAPAAAAVDAAVVTAVAAAVVGYFYAAVKAGHNSRYHIGHYD